jgi:hypothetical protein
MKRDRRNKVLAHLKLMRNILIDRIQTRLRSENVSIVFFLLRLLQFRLSEDMPFNR